MTTNKDRLEELAEEWLLAKRMVDLVKEKFEDLDSMLKELMHKDGVKSIQIEEEVVTLQVSERRTFDAAVLKSLVKPAIFNKVTKPSVEVSLVDAAVSMGDISQEVLDKATKKTEYKKLLVKKGK